MDIGFTRSYSHTQLIIKASNQVIVLTCNSNLQVVNCIFTVILIGCIIRVMLTREQKAHTFYFMGGPCCFIFSSCFSNKLFKQLAVTDGDNPTNDNGHSAGGE